MRATFLKTTALMAAGDLASTLPVAQAAEPIKLGMGGKLR